MITDFSIATMLELAVMPLIRSLFPYLKTPGKCYKSNAAIAKVNPTRRSLPLEKSLGGLAFVGVRDGD